MGKKTISIITILFLATLSVSVSARTVVVQEKSGYNTSTQVVGSRELFVRHQFRVDDFSQWLDLVYRAQAFELFQRLVAEKKISTRGIIITQDIVMGESIAEVGTMLTPEWLFDNMPRTYHGADILKQLMDAKVLDATGFVVDISGTKNIDFNSSDFSLMLPKVLKIALPIENQILAAAILNDLNELIINDHREIEVTNQQTTNFQSRNNDLFSGLLETLGGNFLAKTFSPDKTNISRTSLNYISKVNVLSFYDFKVGFAPFSGFGHHPGQWAINGKKDSTIVNFESASAPALKSFRVDVDYRFINKLSAYTNNFGFNTAKAVYSQYKTDTASISNLYVFFPYISGGAVGNTDSLNGMSTMIGCGLAYSRGTDRNNLGLAINFDLNIPLFYWLNLDTGLIYGFQPRSNDGNVWDRAEFKMALSALLLPQITAEMGYKIMGSTTDTQDNSVYFGLKSYF